MSKIFVTGGSAATCFVIAVLLPKNNSTVFVTMRNPSHKSRLPDIAYK